MTPIIPHDYYAPAERTVFASAITATDKRGRLLISTYGCLITKDDLDWHRLKVHSKINVIKNDMEDPQQIREIIIFDKEKGVPV